MANQQSQGSSTWGGYRPGAGRKPTGRKHRNVYVTDAEYEKVKNLLDRLRENKEEK